MADAPRLKICGVARPEDARLVSESGADFCGIRRDPSTGYYSVPEENVNYPVVHATYVAAVEYAAWRSGRLPTEAEWEFAARGTAGRVYAWGDTLIGNEANFYNPEEGDSVGPGSRPVQTLPVNYYGAGQTPEGVFNLCGNVWEFCSDFYDAGYYGVSPSDNPQGPGTGTSIVIRGGSGSDDPPAIRAANRAYVDPMFKASNVGIRIVRNKE